MNPTLLALLPTEKFTVEQENLRARNAPESLVLHTLKDALYYAKKVSRSLLPDDELFSLCYSALVSAARNYRPEKNCRFAGSRFMGYAKPYVRGEISRAWKAKETVKNGKTFSLDATVDPSFGEPDSFRDSTTENLLPEEAFGVAEPAFAAIDLKEKWSLIEEVINRVLSVQEKMVIDLFYRGSFNFDQIGKLLDVSRSAIQNTHSRAVKKIRCDLLKNHKLLGVA